MCTEEAARVAVVTDSCACIPERLVRELSILTVPLTIRFGAESFLDGVELTAQEFYQRLRHCRELPKTSQPTPEQFLDAFRQAAEKARSVVCITMSGALSGTANAARVAASMLTNATVEVVDSLTATFCEGLLVLDAARQAALGAGLRDIVDRVQSLRPKVHLFAVLDTLDYLVRGGRVGKTAALAGSLLNIKPIITFDRDGEVASLGKVRTLPRALDRIRSLVEEHVAPGERLHVGIMDADAEEAARELGQKVQEQFDCAEVHYVPVSPVIGTYAGPGALGVAVFAASE